MILSCGAIKSKIFCHSTVNCKSHIHLNNLYFEADCTHLEIDETYVPGGGVVPPNPTPHIYALVRERYRPETKKEKWTFPAKALGRQVNSGGTA